MVSERVRDQAAQRFRGLVLPLRFSAMLAPVVGADVAGGFHSAKPSSVSS